MSKVTPKQLIEEIDCFATIVANYLAPTVLFVGSHGPIVEELKRYYPGLIHEEKYTGSFANIVIFDHVPSLLDAKKKRLSSETPYIFIPKKHAYMNEEKLGVLRNYNALTLVDPDIIFLDWHIRMMLVLHDFSYANNQETFPSLISCDIEYRTDIGRIIKSAISSESIHIRVSSNHVRKRLLAFLFDLAPIHLSPKRVSSDTWLTSKSLSRKLYLIDECMVAAPTIKEAFAKSNNIKASLMLVTVDSESVIMDVNDGVLNASLRSLKKRKDDANLIAYWCACYYSHIIGDFKYYSKASVKKNLQLSIDSSSSYIDTMLDVQPSNTKINTDLEAILSKYDRFSIDNILAHTEAMVMDNLKFKSPVIEAASRAAGIPRVTFHKRTKRHNDQQNQIKTHRSVLKP